MPYLSIVVPVYNEEANVDALVAELRATADRLTVTTDVRGTGAEVTLAVRLG